MIRTEMDSMPTELDEVSRKIIQLEIEEAALKKETDSIAKEHLAEIQKEAFRVESPPFNEMKSRWENEKNTIGKSQKLREQIEQVNSQIELAERNYDLNRAAELKYGELPALQKQLEEEESKKVPHNTLLRDKVTDEEIARIVERWTGIR